MTEDKVIGICACGDPIYLGEPIVVRRLGFRRNDLVRWHRTCWDERLVQTERRAN
jgi:hypothetical protein